MFSPPAWLKLMYFLHAGDTEIGGFAISAMEDPLYIEQFVTVEQTTSCVTVEFADDAVADFFDTCVDRGLKPDRFARIWCHTHPGECPLPSSTDERTFERVFGTCDWSVMFIVGRTGKTYARLSFAAGPRAHVLLPVVVDWESWPKDVLAAWLGEAFAQWQAEFEAHIHPQPLGRFQAFGDALDPLPISNGRTVDDRETERLSWWDYEEYEPRPSDFDTDTIDEEDFAIGSERRSEVLSW